MLRKIRIVIAAVIFTLITLLFMDVSGTLHRWLSWLAEIQFWPAVLALNVTVVVALIVLTLVLGRIYCSVICPLGIMQDVISHLHSRRKRNRFRHSDEKKVLRYGFLVLFFAAFALGVGSLVALLSPYSSYGRMAENLLRPLWSVGNNGLAYIAERVGSYTFYSTDVWVKSAPTLLIATATFIIIGWLSWCGGRTYCNTVCPVGAILSFFARFSWMKVRIDEDRCNGCGLCARNCKASCIDSKMRKVDYSRCIVCGNCMGVCHRAAISFTHKKPQGVKHDEVKKSESVSQEMVNSARRAFLFGSVLATASAVLAQDKKKVDGGLAIIEDKVSPERSTPLTPPGSLSAQNMARRCTACQLCVSQCPNGVLRPSTNLLTMMQPTMSYERGYCRPECTRCGEVCPTGAIQKISREEKTAIQIGHAVWVKKNCVVMTDGIECGNCARHCPTGAITMISSDTQNEASLKIPAINAARCIGCGACENLCPSRPFSAIYVEGHEVHREI